MLVALLVLITALPSAIAFAQTMPGDGIMGHSHHTHEHHQHSEAGHPEDDMACASMTADNCVVVASLGQCGSAVAALVPEKKGIMPQSSSGTKLCHYGTFYLSIILDTLTPPPITSKA